RILRAESRPTFLAKSPAMAPVLELVGQIGPSEANVLITGEHGTGKEVVARTLHALSARATKPMVTVNAGGLSEGVFESELHGYAQRYRKNISGFDTAAIKALHEHAWPGNVRELDHAVERGVLLSPGPSVRAADLGLRAQASGGAAKLEEMSLDEVERYLIQRTLSRHEGNVSQEATALGL